MTICSSEYAGNKLRKESERRGKGRGRGRGRAKGERGKDKADEGYHAVSLATKMTPKHYNAPLTSLSALQPFN